MLMRLHQLTEDEIDRKLMHLTVHALWREPSAISAACQGRAIQTGPTLDFLVPPAGFEPATFGLQNRCSTD